MSINRVVLSGNLTRDPQIKATQSGSNIALFTIAVGHFYKGEKKTSFVDVKAFGKNAELLRDYLKKGSPIGIDGTLQQESWESREGEKRSKLVVYCERIDFFGLKKQETQNKTNDMEEKKNYDWF